jgi:glyoxylase-like metal-dependent hydrolase (beta-lactamase superfamily II)
MHLGNPGVIASYLLDGNEPALVDCGPSVCADALEAGLGRRGIALEDVRHLLLTHVHADHAGGAGTLVRRHPGLLVHVSEVGAPHVVDPAKLEANARKLYGEEFDVLFGPIEPVPAENVHVLGERVLGLEVFPTPGHAWHHVAFLGPDGACYVGDAAGSLLPPGRFLYPASAPPGIDLEAWDSSLDAVVARRPRVLRLAHFGEVGDPHELVERARARLAEWAGWIQAGAGLTEFIERVEAELAAEAGETRELYRQLPGFDLSYAGLKRYLDKRSM